MRTVLLSTFHEVEPAEHLRRRLEQAGIQSTIADDSKLQRIWFIPKPLAAVHVFVDRSDEPKAASLIGEWDRSESVLKDAVHCPSCHSVRVEYPQLTRKFVTPSFGSLLMAIGLIPRQFYCCDCHYTWPAEVPVPPQRDELGWPTQSKLWHPEQRSGAKKT